jgi:hypothetical protein
MVMPQKNTVEKKYCKFCEKDGHNGDKCFSWEKVERKFKAAKVRIYEVQDDNNGHSNKSMSTKN